MTDGVTEVVLPRAVHAAMVEHCLQERPNEACGLLARAGQEIVEVIPMRNASASPVRYSLDPKEQFDAYRRIETAGQDLAGVYHSHTRTEAYPSPTDVRLASEDVPYLIVSLADEPPSVRAFRIVKDFITDVEGEIIELPVSQR